MKISADKSSASPTLDKSIMNNPADQTSLSDLLSTNFFSKLISDTDVKSSETESRELDDTEESSQMNPESNQLVQQDAESMLQVIQTMSAQMSKNTPNEEDNTSDLEANLQKQDTSYLTTTIQQTNTSDLEMTNQKMNTILQDNTANSTVDDYLSDKAQSEAMNETNKIDGKMTLSNNNENIKNSLEFKNNKEDALEKIDLLKERKEYNLNKFSDTDTDKIATSLNQPVVSDDFKLGSSMTSHIANNNILDSMEKFSQLVNAKINPQAISLPAGQEQLLTTGVTNLRQTSITSDAIVNQPIITASNMTFHVEEQHMSSQAVGMATYQANIKIYPPELGQINASLKVNNNRAILEITTENAQTKEILNSHLNDLRQQFSQANLQLDSIQINIGQPQTNTKNSDNNQSDTNENQRDAQQAQHAVQMTLQSTETNRKRLNALVDAYI